MAEKTIEIEVNQREAKLILKYGYPFPEQKKLFEAVKNKPGWHSIKIDKYWLEVIIGDLCISLKEIRSRALLEEVNDLCDKLEISVKGGWVYVAAE